VGEKGGEQVYHRPLRVEPQEVGLQVDRQLKIRDEVAVKRHRPVDTEKRKIKGEKGS